eukprot:CAMPEP_0185840924 /NCGR_PEP_ID=MMETSP1353-20130828/17032_1 /TAXON_ID=1077150 /ORGANISM="Erythrolobus australicus, Strain CCMP3124" /LENGTH=94 /DNA_ID=CAMNT_0028540313 /DNA_START=69 /DNA_END=353 /DNA_ORIENTATION=-
MDDMSSNDSDVDGESSDCEDDTHDSDDSDRDFAAVEDLGEANLEPDAATTARRGTSSDDLVSVDELRDEAIATFGSDRVYTAFDYISFNFPRMR